MAFWYFIVMFVASLVIGELLRPKIDSNAPPPSSLGDFDLPTATEGRSIPVVWGLCHIKGPNVLWYGNLYTRALTEEVSTSWFNHKNVTVGYEYYLSMQIAICWGPLYPDIIEVRFGDKIPLQHVLLDSYGVRPIGITINAYDPPDNSDQRMMAGSVGHDMHLRGEMDLYGGTYGTEHDDWWPVQTPSAHLAAVLGVPVSAYKRLAYAVLKDFKVGESSYIEPISFIVKRLPPVDPADEYVSIDGTGASPAAMIRECLTDTVWGLGVDISQIDLPSFQAAHTMLRNEGFGLAMVMEGSTPANDMINEILRHIDGVLYTDPSTGLLTLRVIRLGYTLTGYDPTNFIELDLNPTNVISCEMTRGSWAETKNVIKVNYVDPNQNFTVRTAQAQDLANIQIRGGEIAAGTYDFRGIYSPEVASAVATRILRSSSVPLARLSIVANRHAWNLRPGSAFSLAWPDLGISDLHCRVLRISYGQLAEGKIAIEAVEDAFSVSVGIVAPAPWGYDPHPATGALSSEELIEVPYHMLGDEIRNIAGLGVRSNSMDIGFQAWVDEEGGTDYVQANTLAVVPGGVLETEYHSSDAYDATGFIISGQMLESLAGPTALDHSRGLSLLKIDDEIMAWRNVQSLGSGRYRIYNITRAVLDTLPAKHTAGTMAVFMPALLELVKNTDYPADFTMTAKFLPFSGSDALPLAVALQLEIVTESRAWLPYPPGNVELNGMKWYTSGFADEDDVVLTWSHRHRVNQTAVPEIVDQDAGDYASPEGNYTVLVYADGVLVQTYSAISGTTQTYSRAQRISDDPTAIRFDFHIRPVNGSLVGQERILTTWISGFGLAFGAGFGVGDPGIMS